MAENAHPLAAVYANKLPASLLTVAAVIGIAYFFARALYRLFFHPLAKFPGPRLAAITTFYEGYYEIILNGQYGRKISQLHDKYGPVVRVTPNELHIRDPRFFDDVYSKTLRIDKEGWDYRFGTENGLLTTVRADEHRRRRAAVNPMFSRRAIINLLHIVQRHIETLSARMLEFEARKEPMNLTLAFPALTGDIIMDYFFGFNYAQLKHPEFESFHEGFTKVGPVGHIATQFPAFLKIMNSIPDCITGWLQPAMMPLIQLKKDQWNLIARILRGEDIKTNDAHKTIFTEILNSKLPPEDKTHRRLADEAQIIVGGGVETTAFSLAIAAFHISHNKAIYNTLHQELCDAFPNKSEIDLVKCESLPYLRACIMEATRLGYGLSARNPRTHDKPLVYGKWVIPARTCVSMTIPDISHDETIFPNSKAFIPERWLGEPRTADGIPLEKFHVSFGRGPRSCMGINLAWAELDLTLATMFRRFRFDIFEADVSDVEMAYDHFIPAIKADSKGVRVFVTSTSD